MTTSLLFEPVSLDSRETRGFAAEVKFVVDLDVAARIRRWARRELVADAHGVGPCGDQYCITSVYFDTAEFDVLARRGSFARAKYRVRRYGDADVVFLERKLRTNRLLAKRRTSVALIDLSLLSAAPGKGVSPDWSGEWFRRRLGARCLQPACQISYDRTARVMSTPYGAARLTIDEGLRATAPDFPRMPVKSGAPFGTGAAIVEVKYRVTIPSAFKRLIEQFSLTPVGISKYRFAQEALGRAPVERRVTMRAGRDALACA